LPGQSNLLSACDLQIKCISNNAGLSLLCTLALLNHGVTASSKYHIGGNLGMQRFIEKLIVRSYLPLLIFFVIGTALILSHSRGGVSSSLLGLIVLLGVLNINRSTRNIYMVWIFATFILVGTVIFYMSSDGLIDRLNAQGFTDEARDETYELTWDAILTNPWLGFGLGSFEEVFPLYKSVFISGTFASPHLWDYAHNSYLEAIFDDAAKRILQEFGRCRSMVGFSIRHSSPNMQMIMAVLNQ
jgi:O-antigen ligase